MFCLHAYLISFCLIIGWFAIQFNFKKKKQSSFFLIFENLILENISPDLKNIFSDFDFEFRTGSANVRRVFFVILIFLEGDQLQNSVSRALSRIEMLSFSSDFGIRKNLFDFPFFQVSDSLRFLRRREAPTPLIRDQEF